MGKHSEPHTSKGTGDEQISVNPIPATGHDNLESSITTSKGDYDKVGTSTADEQVSVEPLPATGHDSTKSTVTTSKEDYERAGK